MQQQGLYKCMPTYFTTLHNGSYVVSNITANSAYHAPRVDDEMDYGGLSQ